MGNENSISTTARAAANFGMILTAAIWGFAFVVVKDSTDLIPPIYLLAFRFTIAFIGMAIVFHKKLIHATKYELFGGFVLGLWFFISYVFQTIAIQYTTASKNAFLTAIYVVIVPFLHWGMNRKKPDRCEILAAFLMIFGIGLLSLQGDLSMNLGDILTLICGFGFAMHIVYVNRYTKNGDPITLSVLQTGTCALASWILAPIMDGGFPAAAFAPEIVTGMLYLGIASTLITTLLQNICLKYTAPTTGSLLLSMESVFGALFSVIFLHEIFTIRMIFGCVIIFVSIIVAEVKPKFI